MISLQLDKKDENTYKKKKNLSLFSKQFKFQNALLQHAQRTVYKTGIWTTSERSLQDVPSPAEFSWAKGENNQWQPVWMTIPKVSNVCRELIKCTCKVRCSRCKCAKEKLQCTPLCKCDCPESNSKSDGHL